MTPSGRHSFPGNPSQWARCTEGREPSFAVMADQNTTPSLRRLGRRRQMTSGPHSPAKSLPLYIYHLAFEPPQIQIPKFKFPNSNSQIQIPKFKFMDSPLASRLLEPLSNYS